MKKTKLGENTIVSISINLSKLPSYKMTTAKNGDKYIALEARNLKQAKENGDTLYVSVRRDKGEEITFCGSGAVLDFGQQPDNASNTKSDGLPF